MSTVWSDVDRYIEATLLGTDPVLEHVLSASAAAGLPAISVSPAQGRLLYLLARAVGARRILEIGTLGGYSAIWLARALAPDGLLITLEIEPRHAEVARSNVAKAGLEASVNVRLGRALETLATFSSSQPFDMVFIDADKPSNPDYFAHALRLTRPGGFIVVDNVVRGGAVIDSGSADPAVQGVRRLFELIAKEPRVRGTAIQTVGIKGYDGLAIALVLP